MKKIISKEEQEKKDKRNRFIIGVILIGLMLLSTVGYALYETGSKKVSSKQYNGVDFLFSNGKWYFEMDGRVFSTYFNPEDTENISIAGSMKLGDYTNQALFFSVGSSQDAIQEITSNLGNLVTRTQYVCIEDCEEDLPIKNCSEGNIIITLDVNQTSVKQEDKCVYLLASNEEMIRVSDAFIFKLLGIN